MVTIAEAYEAEGIAPPKRKVRRPEWTLQTKIKAFVREFCACEHEFVAHDRSFDKTGVQHLFEAERGIRRAWMDTELAIQGGVTFRCELKWAPNRVKDDDEQGRLIKRMNELGHPTAWTDSVAGYYRLAFAAGVPWRPGTAARASYLDDWMRATFAKASAPKKARAARRSAPKKAAGKAGRVSARFHTP